MPTYDELEESEYSGHPQEFVLFTVGDVKYPYSLGDVEVTYAGDTYPTFDLETSNLQQSLEREQTEITITASRKLPLAQLFVKMLPPFEITVTIFRNHFDLTDPPVSWWSGLVTGVDIKKDLAQIKCSPLITVYKRLGLRYLFQGICNHLLYHPETCRVNPDDYKFTGAVYDLAGVNLKSAVFAAKPNGYFTGGFLRRVENGDLRFVIDHVGDTVTVWYPFEDQPEFDQVEAFAGCDHSDATCDSKFGNLVNCGCWPTVPKANPAAKRFA